MRGHVLVEGGGADAQGVRGGALQTGQQEAHRVARKMVLGLFLVLRPETILLNLIPFFHKNKIRKMR